MEENCKGCAVPMWTEGKIDDDIPLCHACYQDEALRIRWTEEGECDDVETVSWSSSNPTGERAS
jgi:hypothetical protein